MNLISIVAVFFVVWWLVLFVVLPFGVRTQSEEQDVVLGTSHSAPARLHLVRAALVTTAVAAVVVFGIWLLIDVGGYDVEYMADHFGFTGRR